MIGLSIPEKCRLCQKFSPSHEFVGIGHARYCWRCYERKMRSIAEVRGMRDCCDCQRAILGAEPGQSPMCRLVPRDGIWQLICETCYQRWIRLAPGLVKDTPHGKALNL